MFRGFLFILYLFSIAPAAAYAQAKPSISAEAFGQLPSFKSIKLSPDGNRMASLRNYKGKTTLITQSMDPAEKGEWHAIAFDEGEYKWFKWLTNDRLAVSVRIPVNENGVKYITTRLFALDWDKKNPINLIKTQRRTGKNIRNRVMSQFQDKVVSFLPDDPDHILLALDHERVNHPFVYKVNIHNGKRNIHVKIASSIDRWMADKKGVVRLGFGGHKVNNRIIYRESKAAAWQEIANYDAVKDDAPFHPVGFSPDTKIIYVSVTAENGFEAIFGYNIETEEFVKKVASQEGADITDFYQDEQENILGYRYYDDMSHVVNLDRLWQRIGNMTAKFFPDQQATIASHSKDKKKFIIKVSSAVTPGDYYFLDLNTNKIDWFSEAYSGLDAEKLSPMKSVNYKARDGLEIPAFLSLPIGAESRKNLPTVIMPHGGPFARDEYGFDYWVQFLTTRGYAVLQMNYRGSTGYGAAFKELGEKEWGGKMLDDINDGAKWMIAQGYADPSRLCILGGSYGGYAALQSLVKEPDLYKCAVAMAPVTSMLRLYKDFKKFKDLREKYMPYIRSEEDSLSDISPVNNIDKINVPVLLVHGTKDRSVDYRHGETFAKKMKQQKKDIRFITLKDGDHYLSLQKHRIKFFSEVEKFLEKNL